MRQRWLWLIALWLPLNVVAGGVQAALDRNDVHLGETVTLNLRVDGSVDASTPDLSALNNDFDVLGSSANSTLTVENGHPSAQVIIGIALRPKHVGDLQIPALTVAGSQTTPLTLRVEAPDKSAAANDGKNVFIDVAGDPNHGFVGQQLLLTVRLFYNVNLNGGTLPDPQADGADLRRMGGDTDYDVDRNGRRYHVVERRYALIPQHAGTLTIPSIEFQGDAVDPGNPSDPGFSGLFGNSTPVSADSSPLTIDVQAPPSVASKGLWLPARSLTLSLDGIPADGKVTVGQPINLHMTVQATGLTADALPQPSLADIDGATVYPDQTTNTTQDDRQWLTGRRERGFAVFPKHAGTLTIPATTLTWFDVTNGTQQVATIPAHTLTVSAAANTMPAASSSTAPATSTAMPATASSVARSAPSSLDVFPLWRWIAIASMLLWIVTVVAFLLWRRRKAPITSGSPAAPRQHPQSLQQAFMHAARSGDATSQAHSLLAWARAERPGLHNLGELSEALASDTQRAAIETLQQWQFAARSDHSTVDLADAFEHGFVWKSSGESDDTSPLPPLYPFKLD